MECTGSQAGAATNEGKPDYLPILARAVIECGPAAQTLAAIIRLCEMRKANSTFASIARIADKACLPRRTVERHIRQLIAAGWIVCLGRDGRRTATLQLTPKAIEERRKLFARLPRAAAQKLAAHSWGARLLYSIIEARGGQPTARWVQDNLGVAKGTVKAARQQLRAAGLLAASPRRNGTKVAHIGRAKSGADEGAKSGARGGPKVAHEGGQKWRTQLGNCLMKRVGDTSSPQILEKEKAKEQAKAIYGELVNWIAPRDCAREDHGELKWVCAMVARGKLPPAVVISAAEKVAALDPKPLYAIEQFFFVLNRSSKEFRALQDQALADAARRRAEDAARRDEAVLEAAADGWLAYKQERGEGYKPAARQALTAEMRRRAALYGAAAVAAAMDAAMAANAGGWNYPSRFEGCERKAASRLPSAEDNRNWKP
jgi:DNA-binding MarR family transcriptional regulator